MDFAAAADSSHQRGVLLGGRVHVRDGVIDLIDTGGLLGVAAAISATMFVTFATPLTISASDPARVADQLRARIDLRRPSHRSSL